MQDARLVGRQPARKTRRSRGMQGARALAIAARACIRASKSRLNCHMLPNVAAPAKRQRAELHRAMTALYGHVARRAQRSSCAAISAPVRCSAATPMESPNSSDSPLQEDLARRPADVFGADPRNAHVAGRERSSRVRHRRRAAAHAELNRGFPSSTRCTGRSRARAAARRSRWASPLASKCGTL